MEFEDFTQIEEQLKLLENHKNIKEIIKDKDTELFNLEKDYTRLFLSRLHDIFKLYDDIQHIHQVLDSVSTDLSGYQSSISQMNAEIADLHSTSSTMDFKLQNRIKAHHYLSKDLESIVISPDLVKKICEGEVNEFYLNHVQELDSKLEYLSRHEEKDVLALKATMPELDRLRLKASEKIQDFLLRRIETLLQPNTNIALIQQNVLLKYKELFWFLMQRYEEVGIEVHQSYIATVSTYFTSQFEKYTRSLNKFVIANVQKTDMIGGEEKRGGLFGKSVPAHIFGLGTRLQVLTGPDSWIIVPHHTQDQKLFEAVFKSVNRVLIDNACSEYVFTCTFFNKDGKQHVDSLQTFFNQVFEPTLKLVQFIKTNVEASFDAIGVLICIRVNQQHIRVLQKRMLPHLDGYLNLVNMLLWPRFQAIMGMHIDSLKKADAKKIGSKEPGVHFVTRRYAEFSSAILTLNQGFEDGLVVHSLSRMRAELESLLYRLAAEYTEKKASMAFWIHNMDCVMQVLNQFTGPTFDEEKQFFENKYEEKCLELVKFVVGSVMPSLSTLLEKHERGQIPTKDMLEKCASEFQQGWKGWLVSVHEQIMTAFSNFQVGGRVLHLGLSQFVIQYKTFLGIWEDVFKGTKSRVAPVGIQSVLVEIKKFKSNYQ